MCALLYIVRFQAVELVKVHCLQPELGLQQAALISYACPEENAI